MRSEQAIILTGDNTSDRGTGKTKAISSHLLRAISTPLRDESYFRGSSQGLKQRVVEYSTVRARGRFDSH